MMPDTARQHALRILNQTHQVDPLGPPSHRPIKAPRGTGPRQAEPINPVSCANTSSWYLCVDQLGRVTDFVDNQTHCTARIAPPLIQYWITADAHDYQLSSPAIGPVGTPNVYVIPNTTHCLIWIVTEHNPTTNSTIALSQRLAIPHNSKTLTGEYAVLLGMQRSLPTADNVETPLAMEVSIVFNAKPEDDSAWRYTTPQGQSYRLSTPQQFTCANKKAFGMPSGSIVSKGGSGMAEATITAFNSPVFAFPSVNTTHLDWSWPDLSFEFERYTLQPAGTGVAAVLVANGHTPWAQLFPMPGDDRRNPWQVNSQSDAYDTEWRWTFDLSFPLTHAVPAAPVPVHCAAFLGLCNNGPARQPVYLLCWIDPAAPGTSKLARPSLPLLPKPKEQLLPFLTAIPGAVPAVYALLQSGTSVFLIVTPQLSFQNSWRTKLPCHPATILGLFVDQALTYPNNIVILCAKKDTDVAPLIAVVAHAETGEVHSLKVIEKVWNRQACGQRLVSASPAGGGVLVYRGPATAHRDSHGNPSNAYLAELLHIRDTTAAVAFPGLFAVGIVAINSTGYLIDQQLNLYSFPLAGIHKVLLVGSIRVVGCYSCPLTPANAADHGAWVDPHDSSRITALACALRGREVSVFSLNS
eukprot:TRINITY_DN1421_c0_g1_i8.p1 TRINITY_DN1421_c0_g1~~TRINITY_DN1421_c0_g1_i8.p1  ORF type:complete len:637 (+),score=68.98 TRINITY_DN1421_c0_g1_i8:511-2421(+)